jgi:Fe-S cluster biogenesis protein NfuA
MMNNIDLKNRLSRILIDEVAPALHLDPSAIEVRDVTDGVVQLSLGSVCAGCPSTLMVLMQGLEQELRQRVPEVEYVELIP